MARIGQQKLILYTTSILTDAAGVAATSPVVLSTRAAIAKEEARTLRMVKVDLMLVCVGV